MKIAICGLKELKDVWAQTKAPIVLSLMPGITSEQVFSMMPQGTGAAVAWVQFPFEDVEDPNNPEAPTMADMAEILDEEWVAPGEYLLIHCAAGISRSTAAAFAILCKAMGPGREREALLEIRRIRNIAYPNRLMVAYADILLERDGAMLAAVEAIDGKPSDALREALGFRAA